MVRRTLYEKLGKFAGQFKWKLKDGAIRGYKKVKGVEKEFCPITAVHYAINRKYVNPVSVDKAAECLDIDGLSMDLITVSADTEIVNNDGPMREIRRTLLRRVGLQ